MGKKLNTVTKYQYARAYFENGEIKETRFDNEHLKTENQFFNRFRRMSLGEKPIEIVVGNTLEDIRK